MKLRRSLLTSLALTIVMLGAATPSEAKCAFARYRFSFQVVSEATGTPVAGASIAVFANASDRELSKEGAANVSAETGADGVFAAEYRFNTYSGSGLVFADRCHERIKTLVVVVRHPRYRERRVALSAKQFKVRPAPDSLAFDVVLPTIRISPEGAVTIEVSQMPQDRYVARQKAVRRPMNAALGIVGPCLHSLSARIRRQRSSPCRSRVGAG